MSPAELRPESVTTVTESKPCQGGWTVTDDQTWSFFVPDTACKVPPQVGETCKLSFTKGGTIRGVEIGGRVYCDKWIIRRGDNMAT